MRHVSQRSFEWYHKSFTYRPTCLLYHLLMFATLMPTQRDTSGKVENVIVWQQKTGLFKADINFRLRLSSHEMAAKFVCRQRHAYRVHRVINHKRPQSRRHFASRALKAVASRANARRQQDEIAGSSQRIKKTGTTRWPELNADLVWHANARFDGELLNKTAIRCTAITAAYASQGTAQ